jgi:hypothetical protein
VFACACVRIVSGRECVRVGGVENSSSVLQEISHDETCSTTTSSAGAARTMPCRGMHTPPTLSVLVITQGQHACSILLGWCVGSGVPACMQPLASDGPMEVNLDTNTISISYCWSCHSHTHSLSRYNSHRVSPCACRGSSSQSLRACRRASRRGTSLLRSCSDTG